MLLKLLSYIFLYYFLLCNNGRQLSKRIIDIDNVQEKVTCDVVERKQKTDRNAMQEIENILLERNMIYETKEMFGYLH